MQRTSEKRTSSIMRIRYAEDPGEKDSNKTEGIGLGYAEDLREKDFINNEDKIS